MPGLIDPTVVDAVSQFLQQQIAAADTRAASVQADTEEETEHQQDYWSHISSQWETTRTAWRLANIPQFRVTAELLR